MKVKLFSNFAVVVCMLLFFNSPLFSGDLKVKKGDKIAIIGDSITEQKQYSKFMEAYLVACVPELDLKTLQYGWGGETAPGFTHRMAYDILAWNPTLATTCYGMNDGAYRPYEDWIGKRYNEGMSKIVDFMKKNNVRMIIGSPGVVDTDTWNQGNPDADKFYNANLSKLAGIAKDLAAKNSFPYADVNGYMHKAMDASKAKYGPKYHVGGGDGVHPWANGHLVMAYAFLKSMGFSGKIAEISVDFSSKKANASDGHNILNQNVDAKKSTLELNSSKYPFCFQNNGNLADTNNLVGILPYVNFQQDLNVFELKVVNLPTAKATVKWGPSSKEFTKAQLEKGINLADEFYNNPFSHSFNNIMAQIAHKQHFETEMVKKIFATMRSTQHHVFEQKDKEEIAKIADSLKNKYLERHSFWQNTVRTSVTPVKHSIEITPIN
ncbi:MAG: SGNH/GDSL hydrolase family protein [Lentisphaeraceae bacterium]|nr:SGNH/GDSL hydrolase family protein [Lentisphaeraceae bacterium]